MSLRAQPSPQHQHPRPSTRPAVFPADHATVTSLFLAYAASLPIRLDFQGFEHELAGLPGKFAPEANGALFLAWQPVSGTLGDAGRDGDVNVDGDGDGDGNGSVNGDARTPSRAIGCVALRAFAAPHVAELKRLYIVPEARGTGAARALMDVVLARARELGYSEVLLDTLGSMVAARRLYEGYGFVETDKYYESIEGAVFYRLVL